MPNCSMVIFVHLPKTGGTTVSAMLDGLRAWPERPWNTMPGFLGRWNFVQTRAKEWSWVHKLALEDTPGFVRRHPRTYFVVHQYFPGQMQRVLLQARELRRRYASLGCTFVTFTLFREPLSWAVSSWNYHAPTPSRAATSKMGCHADIAAFTGADPQVGWLLTGADPHCSARAAPLPACERAALWAMLRDDFDLVGTTERFDETLLLAARLAGMGGGAVRYARANGAKPKEGAMKLAQLNATTRAALAAQLRLDAEAHRWAAEQLAARVAAAAPPLQHDLDRLRACTVGTHVGGAPASAPTGWHGSGLTNQVPEYQELELPPCELATAPAYPCDMGALLRWASPSGAVRPRSIVLRGGGGAAAAPKNGTWHFRFATMGGAYRAPLVECAESVASHQRPPPPSPLPPTSC